MSHVHPSPPTQNRRGYIRSFLWLWIALVVLTVAATIPVDVVGPFDVRTGHRAEGFHADYAWIGVVLEPALAVAQIIGGSPDVRAAAISLLVWVGGIAGIWAIIRTLRSTPQRAPWKRALDVLGMVGVSLLVLGTYAIFALLVHIPNWRVNASDPDVVLAELHSHTFGSHDGVISAEDSLRWHRQRGCDVVAVTEHNSPAGSLAALELSQKDTSLPIVLPGVETYRSDLAYYVGFGPAWQMKQYVGKRLPQDFIESIHGSGPGAVLALRWRLRQRGTERLIDAGIDGFELASDGHPSIKADVDDQVRQTLTAHALPAVAWTDWHGWGAVLRTWTAIRIPGAAKMSREELADQVVATFRNRQAERVTPLLIGQMGEMSIVQTVFCPWIELGRYAMGLSAGRVVSWWVWAIAFVMVGRFMAGWRLGVSQVFGGGVLIGMGVPIIHAAGRLCYAYISGESQSTFPLEIGGPAVLAGVAATVWGGVLVFKGIYLCPQSSRIVLGDVAADALRVP